MWASKTGKGESTAGMINLGLHAGAVPAADLPGLPGIRPAHPARRLDRVHSSLGAGRPGRPAGILPPALAGVETPPLLHERQASGGVARATGRFLQPPQAANP